MKVDMKMAGYEARQEIQLSKERETKNPESSLIDTKKFRALGPLNRMMDDGKLK